MNRREVLLEEARMLLRATDAKTLFQRYGFEPRLHWNNEMQQYEIRAYGRGLEKYVATVKNYDRAQPEEREARIRQLSHALT